MEQISFDFDAMRNVDVSAVDPKELVDINTVDIKTDLPFTERAYDFIMQVGNAYCYLCGDVIVKVSHDKTDATVTDCVEEIIRSYSSRS